MCLSFLQDARRALEFMSDSVKVLVKCVQSVLRVSVSESTDVCPLLVMFLIFKMFELISDSVTQIYRGSRIKCAARLLHIHLNYFVHIHSAL